MTKLPTADNVALSLALLMVLAIILPRSELFYNNWPALITFILFAVLLRVVLVSLPKFKRRIEKIAS